VRRADAEARREQLVLAQKRPFITSREWIRCDNPRRKRWPFPLRRPNRRLHARGRCRMAGGHGDALDSGL